MITFALAIVLFIAAPLVAVIAKPRRITTAAAGLLLAAAAAQPVVSRIRPVAVGLARLHHGPVNVYAGYVLLALVLTLLVSRVLL